MAHYIERCAALYMHLICTAVCVCMRFITVKNAAVIAVWEPSFFMYMTLQ